MSLETTGVALTFSMLLLGLLFAVRGSRIRSQRSPRSRREEREAWEDLELRDLASRKRRRASAASCAARAASACASRMSSCSDDTELLGDEITCSMVAGWSLEFTVSMIAGTTILAL